MAKRKNKIEKHEAIEVEIEEVIETQEIESVEELKMTKVKIYNVEKKAFLANVFGVPKRIYFDLAFKDLEYLHDNLQSYKNKMLTIYYMGSPTDMQNVKILPIKSLEDIGNRR